MNEKTIMQCESMAWKIFRTILIILCAVSLASTIFFYIARGSEYSFADADYNDQKKAYDNAVYYAESLENRADAKYEEYLDARYSTEKRELKEEYEDLQKKAEKALRDAREEEAELEELRYIRNRAAANFEDLSMLVSCVCTELFLLVLLFIAWLKWHSAYIVVTDKRIILNRKFGNASIPLDSVVYVHRFPIKQIVVRSAGGKIWLPWLKDCDALYNVICSLLTHRQAEIDLGISDK